VKGKEPRKVQAIPNQKTNEPADGSRTLSRIESLADELANLAEKTPAPFSLFKKVVISEEIFYNILNELVESQPEELVEAQKILNKKDDIVKNSHEEAQKVIEVAQRRLEELTSEQEVVKHAEKEAARIIRDAEVRADQVRVEVIEYVYKEMVKLEQNFAATLNTIRNGKTALEKELSQTVTSADVYSEGEGR
jgi:F0F1-type ATP synthase membrane subunit b/b'